MPEPSLLPRTHEPPAAGHSCHSAPAIGAFCCGAFVQCRLNAFVDRHPSAPSRARFCGGSGGVLSILTVLLDADGLPPASIACSVTVCIPSAPNPAVGNVSSTDAGRHGARWVKSQASECCAMGRPSTRTSASRMPPPSAASKPTAWLPDSQPLLVHSAPRPFERFGGASSRTWTTTSLRRIAATPLRWHHAAPQRDSILTREASTGYVKRCSKKLSPGKSCSPQLWFAG